MASDGNLKCNLVENKSEVENGKALFSSEYKVPLQNEIKPLVHQKKKHIKRPPAIKVKGTMPYRRNTLFKWNGWGYNDSHFIAINNTTYFTGDRYPVCNKSLPFFLGWVKERFGVDTESACIDPVVDIPKNYKYPDLKISKEQLDSLKTLNIKMSTENTDRLDRSHGQALFEVLAVNNNAMKRIPDVVIWPECHEDVVDIITMANEMNIVVIPFGGGTSVSGSVQCPQNEERPILSLDTSMMNDILWIDKESLIVCCQSGIIGQDLDRELNKLGFTVGHQPDSVEFSTLGGWVATRASGMKKNTYGNIEDLVINIKMVTPSGILEKNCAVPRMSCGPDFNNITMGSEGCFGVITEVTIKMFPCPPFTLFGSLVFPDFESGLKCFRDIAKQRCQPTSIRMMDNEQFCLGKSLRPEMSYFGIMLEGIKMAYIEKIKGFDSKKMCLTTILYEGQKSDIIPHEKKINAIALKYNGVPAGKKNGQNGYTMTFVIAYIRDVANLFAIMCESLETSVPWENAQKTVDAVRNTISKECEAVGLKHHAVMCRIAQTYDSGCCIYFYFAFRGEYSQENLNILHRLEDVARDVIISNRGSISHHHGVGKMRRKWYEMTVSSTGQELFKAIKHQLDPKNIFATTNMVENINILPSKL